EKRPFHWRPRSAGLAADTIGLPVRPSQGGFWPKVSEMRRLRRPGPQSVKPGRESMRRTLGSRGSPPMAESNFRDGERSVHGDAAAARQPDPLDARRRGPRLARAAGVLQSDAVRLRLRLLPRGDRALLREGAPADRRRLL